MWLIFFRLSVLFEKETEDFHKQDPDPFDDRHPSKCLRVLDDEFLIFFCA